MPCKWRKHIRILLIAFILILTVVLAAVRLMGREDAGGIRLIQGSKEKTVDIGGLDQTDFSGEMVNGLGEVTRHDFRGAFLLDILHDAGFLPEGVKTVTVTGEDAYKAEFTVEEIREEGRIWLAMEDNGSQVKRLNGSPGANLIVFFEDNSRRNVRAVESIELYE